MIPLTIDPGHPPIVNIARSHKLAVNELGSAIEDVGVPFDSNNFGRKMLNIVNAMKLHKYRVADRSKKTIDKKNDHSPALIAHHTTQTTIVVFAHSGVSVSITRSHHAHSGRLMNCGKNAHTLRSTSYTEDRRRDIMLARVVFKGRGRTEREGREREVRGGEVDRDGRARGGDTEGIFATSSRRPDSGVLGSVEL